MDTATALQARRDVRDFSSRPLSEEHLHVILEAGRAAPSSQNWQPWNFVVVIEQSRREELAKVWRGAEHVVRAAAAVALVAPLPTDARQHDRVHYDLGQATMCMMLAATDVGVASAGIRQEKKVSVPSDHHPKTSAVSRSDQVTGLALRQLHPTRQAR